MFNLINAISIDCVFKFAVALILIIKFLEIKDKVILWWAIGWFFFGLHAVLELYLIKTDYKLILFIHHILYLLPAAAFFQSIANMKQAKLKMFHTISILLPILALLVSYIGVFITEEWYVSSIPAAFINGLSFIICSFVFFKFTKNSHYTSRILIFLGFFLNGVHNLDYPFLRPVEWFAPIGFSLGVIFSIILAVGLVLKGIQAIREEVESQRRSTYNLLALYNIATTINQTLDLNVILKQIVESVPKVIKGGESVAIFLIKTKNIFVSAYRGVSEKFMQSFEKILNQGKVSFLNEILSTGNVEIVESWSKEDYVLQKIIKEEGILTSIFIPFKSKDKIVGLGVVALRKARKFSLEEIRLLISFGNTASIAIENSELYGELKRINKELEIIVAERTKDLDDAGKATLNMLEDVNQAYEELKQTQNKLVRSERLAAIGRMAAIISHELKNPLAGIKTSVYYLKTSIKNKNEKINFATGNIEKEIDRSVNIINEILTLSKELKLNIILTKVNIIIEDALNFIAQKDMLNDVNISKDLNNNIPDVLIDSERIRQVIINLLMNAVQSMQLTQRAKKLFIKSRVKNKEIEITVKDTGIGISDDKLVRIFEPFFTDKAEGTGLGLALVKDIIEKHDGKIKVKSKADQGTSFIINLPLKIGEDS